MKKKRREGRKSKQIRKTLYPGLKRLQDIVLSSGGLVVLSPLMLGTVVAIKAEDPSAPVLFRQKRIGKDGKEFEFYKFRSMIPGAEEQIEELREMNEMRGGPMFKIKDDPRITNVGKYIRKYSIDELPQLVNVLKGEMSLVGPRPSLPREVRKFNDHQRKRLSVTPGLTCYWQTRDDRNDLPFDEWVRLDLEYIEDRSVTTDLKIILKTIGTVLKGEGV